MRSSVRQCDSTLLRRLLDGSLSGPDERAVIEHLDTCASCQRELELSAGDATSWMELQTSLAEGLPSQNSSDYPTGDAIVGLGRPLELADYGFLAPSDDPRMLGRIGLYEIAGLIGRGSTGIVFKAYEPALHRYVAIKVLAPELAHSSAGRKRFAREACAAAAVTHEHIVPIYAVSEFQGLPYLVMQYVAGHSLQDRIDRHGALAVVEAVRIALQTARALAAAHQQGLVHRDIKPGNILLTSGIENALVTDFGLARVADDASMTHSGLISGTPQYMSPEQARGESVGPQSDLFSLGSVIYTMCTGHSPFRAETMFGVIRRVCEVDPRPMREVNPDVPDWFDRFTERLLSKTPEKRFHDAAEVVALLENELAHLQNPTAIPLPKRTWLKQEDRGSLWRRRLTAACAGAILLTAWCTIWIVTNATPKVATQGPNVADSEETSEKNWNGIPVRCSTTGGTARIDTSPDRCLVQMDIGNDTVHTIVIKTDEMLFSSDVLGLKDRRWEVGPCREIKIEGAGDRVAVMVVEQHSGSSSSGSSNSTSNNGASHSTSESSTSTSVSTEVKSLEIATWNGKRIEMSLAGGNSVESSIDREGDACRIEINIDGGRHKRVIHLEPGAAKVDGKTLDIGADYSKIGIEATRRSLTIKADGKVIERSKGDARTQPR